MSINIQGFDGHMLSVLLGRYLGMELLGYVVILCLSFEELPDYFPKYICHFTFHLPSIRVPICLHPCQHLLFSIILIIAILEGIKGYITNY